MSAAVIHASNRSARRRSGFLPIHSRRASRVSRPVLASRPIRTALTLRLQAPTWAIVTPTMSPPVAGVPRSAHPDHIEITAAPVNRSAARSATAWSARSNG